MSCQVTYNADNTVKEAKTPNGEPSSVYNELKGIITKFNIPITEKEMELAEKTGVPITNEGKALLHWASTYKQVDDQTKSVFGTNQNEILHPYQVRYGSYNSNSRVANKLAYNSFTSLEEKKEYTVQELLDHVGKNTKNGFNKFLVQQLLRSVPLDLVVKVNNYKSKPTKKVTLGTYNYKIDAKTGKLISEGINLNIYDNGQSGFNEQVFLHEVVHAATVFILNSKISSLTPEQQEAKYQLEQLFQLAKQKLVSQNEKDYGFTNIKEFVSELMTNPEFAEKLGKLKLNNNVPLRTQFVSWLLKLLGIKTTTSTDNLYVAAMDNIITLMDGNDYIRQQKLADVEVQEEESEFSTNQQRLIDNSNKINVGIDPTTGKEEDFYIDTVTGEKRKRVTDPKHGLNNMIKGKLYDKSFEEFIADEIWKNDPPTKPLVTPMFSKEGAKTKDEFIEALRNNSRVAMLQGSIRELVIKTDYTNDPTDQAKLNSMIQELRDLTGNQNIGFEWMTRKEQITTPSGAKIDVDNMAKIHTLMGSNAKMRNVPSNVRDQLSFGITVQSKALNYAGTMDIGVMHPNGDITGIELKTGAGFLRDANHKALLKHGADLGITATNLNMAKLQLVWYAVFARLNDPSIQFRNLKVLYANNEHTLSNSPAVTALGTEVNDYLELIQKFLRDGQFLQEMGMDPDSYAKLEQEFISNGGTNLRELFNSSRYFNDSPFTTDYSSTQNVANGTSTDLEDLVNLSKGIPDRIVGAKLADAQQKAANFLNRFKALSSAMDANQVNNPFAVEVRATLSGSLYQYNDWASDVMQALNIYKTKVSQEFERDATLNTNIISAFQRRIMPGGLESLLQTNKTKFDKFFTTEKILDANGQLIREEIRLLHDTEAVGSKEQAKYNALTTEEKQALDHFNKRIEHWIGENGVFSKAVINDVVTGEQVSELDIFNREKGKSFTYYKGWYPKVIVATEMEFQENLGGPKSKQILETLKTKIGGLFTDIIKLEKQVKDESFGIPLKNMGNDMVLNDPEKSQIYTYDIFRALSSFEADMQHKYHFDSYYHLGRVVSAAFSDAQLTNQYGVKRFANKEVGEWLSDHIKINVLKQVKQGLLLRNPIPIDTKYGARQIDVSDIILKLNSVAASGIMAFRVASAVGNLVGPGLINLRGRLVNEVLKVLNVDEKYLDTRMTSYLNVNGQVKNFLQAKFTDKLHKDKVFLMAQENNFMINFDAAKAVSNTVQSSRFSASSAYDKFKFYLQNTSEEITSVNLMVAQMYNIKHNGKPLYDYYETFEVDEDGNIADTAENRSKLQAKTTELGKDNMLYTISSKPSTGAYRAIYVGTKRFTEKSGTGNNVTYTDVYGLSAQEINRMKTIYDRKHGEYRERFSMETNALASMFIMLKRYVPRVLKNLFESRKSSDALGAYQEIPGEDGVYEWKPEYISGRVRLLVGLIAPVLTRDKNGTVVNWKNMSIEERKLAIDTLLSAAMFASLYGLYALLFGDADDDETMKKWFKRYAVDNANQEINILELSKDITGATVPVPLEFVDRAANGFSELFMASVNVAVGNEEDAYTTRGDLKGLNKTLRSIPITAWGWDTWQKLQNAEFFDPSKGR